LILVGRDVDLDQLRRPTDASRAPLRRAGTDLWYRPSVQAPVKTSVNILAVERAVPKACVNAWGNVSVDRNASGSRSITRAHASSIGWPAGDTPPTPQRNQTVHKNDDAPLIDDRPYTSAVVRAPT
jgi:hypothetical protein